MATTRQDRRAFNLQVRRAVDALNELNEALRLMDDKLIYARQPELAREVNEARNKAWDTREVVGRASHTFNRLPRHTQPAEEVK